MWKMNRHWKGFSKSLFLTSACYHFEIFEKFHLILVNDIVLLSFSVKAKGFCLSRKTTLCSGHCLYLLEAINVQEAKQY